MEIKKLLDELKEVLKKELEYEEALARTDEQKRKLVKEIEPLLMADSYSNSFVRLQKRYTLVIDPNKVPEEYTDRVRKVTDDGRRLIESEIAFGKEVEGVKYLEKLICYKKKNGLREQ